MRLHTAPRQCSWLCPHDSRIVAQERLTTSTPARISHAVRALPGPTRDSGAVPWHALTLAVTKPQIPHPVIRMRVVPIAAKTSAEAGNGDVAGLTEPLRRPGLHVLGFAPLVGRFTRPSGAAEPLKLRHHIKLIHFSLILAIALLLVARAPGRAAELEPRTLLAWDEYVREATVRMNARLRGGGVFLWADESPDRGIRLRKGEILASPAVENGLRSVPGGLIHHWVGAVFVPGATLDSVLAVVHDYDRYKEFYKPVVADSRRLEASPLEQRFSMLWVRRVLFVTAALDNQYLGQDFPVDATHWYGIAESTRVQQIKKYGEDGERRLPPDQGDGYIWRLSSIARYQERDGGVYIELEAMVLSCDIPVSLHWLLKPVVTRLSRNGLITSLQQTRDAVLASLADRIVTAPGAPVSSFAGSQ